MTALASSPPLLPGQYGEGPGPPRRTLVHPGLRPAPVVRDRDQGPRDATELEVAASLARGHAWFAAIVARPCPLSHAEVGTPCWVLPADRSFVPPVTGVCGARAGHRPSASSPPLTHRPADFRSPR